MLRLLSIIALVALSCHEPEPLPPFEASPVHHLCDPVAQSDAGSKASMTTQDRDAGPSDAAARGLTAEEIRLVVKSHAKQLGRCFDGGDGAPPTPGSLVASWDISPTGEVSHATITRGTLLGTPTATCVVDEISTMQFPATGIPNRVAAYPFKFDVGK